MANLTLKNVPSSLYSRLKQSAGEHRRSINSEAIVCLENALTSRHVDPDSFLVSVRALRESLGGVFLTDKELQQARSEGRP
jgi:plasmid stability protein